MHGQTRHSTLARTAGAAAAGVAFAALSTVAGCGAGDLSSASQSSAFNSNLSGNYSGYGGGANGSSRAAGVVTGRGTYAKLEATFELPDVKGDPFDYVENDVEVTIQRPDNKTAKVPAFFDGGAANHTWRVRYTPDMPGKYVVSKVSLNGIDVQPDKLDKREMETSGTPEPGFVRRDGRDKERFAFDNGNSYYPIGQNDAWGAKPDDVAAVIEKMGKAGENWARVWMASWGGLNLDWGQKKSVQPGQIDLDTARAWDKIIDTADKSGVYVQMVLQHHGQYSSHVDPNWDQNPWNKKNGGFLDSPDEFFSNPRAIALTKSKLRYIVARYGYSPHIMAFELFNEVENTDAILHKHDNEVAAWHDAMSDFVRKQDPNRHLITSSSGIEAAMLGHSLDYWQPHAYVGDPVSVVAALDARKLDRPVFYGEIGPAGDLSKDTGGFLHRALWASMMSEAGGAAQYWSWETIDKSDLYGQMHAASEFMRESGLLSQRSMVTAAAAVTTTERAPVTVSPGGSWGQARQTEFDVPPSGDVRGIGALPAYLQGQAHRSMFPSVAFKVSYPEPGLFSVAVGKVAKNGGAISVTIDGAAAAEKSFAAGDGDHSVDVVVEAKVPAGDHVVKVSNPGADWVTLQRFTFAPYGPALAAVGKAGKDFAAFWLTNRLTDKSDGVKGKLSVPGLASGSYKVTWWDTTTGRAIGDSTVQASAGTVLVETPAIVHDAAVTIAQTRDHGAAKAASSGRSRPQHATQGI